MDKVAKAITAAITAGFAGYLGGVPGCSLDTAQHIGIGVAAAAVSFLAVWAIPNTRA